MRVLRHWKKITQQSCGYVIPGDIQNLVGLGFEQSNLVEDIPASHRGVGTR